jgi:hypothetical protein
MKSFVIGLIIIFVAVAVGTIIYSHRQNTLPTPTPVAESSSQQMPPEKAAAPKPEQPQTLPPSVSEHVV